jgi:hypothetical protein
MSFFGELGLSRFEHILLFSECVEILGFSISSIDELGEEIRVACGDPLAVIQVVRIHLWLLLCIAVTFILVE